MPAINMYVLWISGIRPRFTLPRTATCLHGCCDLPSTAFFLHGMPLPRPSACSLPPHYARALLFHRHLPSAYIPAAPSCHAACSPCLPSAPSYVPLPAAGAAALPFLPPRMPLPGTARQHCHRLWFHTEPPALAPYLIVADTMHSLLPDAWRTTLLYLPSLPPGLPSFAACPRRPLHLFSPAVPLLPHCRSSISPVTTASRTTGLQHYTPLTSRAVMTYALCVSQPPCRRRAHSAALADSTMRRYLQHFIFIH